MIGFLLRQVDSQIVLRILYSEDKLQLLLYTQRYFPYLVGHRKTSPDARQH